MNILLVTAEYPPYGSGIANVCLRLRNQMVEKGVAIDVLTPRGENTNTISALGLVGLIPFWEKAANHIAKKSGEYDVIWLHSPLLINAKKLGHAKKILLSVHSTYFGFYGAYKSHGVGHLLPYYYFGTKLENRFFKGLASNINTVVTTVSPSVAEEVLGNGLILAPHVVPNGFEMNYRLTVDKYHARELLNREYSLNVGENDRVLLYIGRITDVKQSLLLALLFETGFAETNTHLIMLGHGNLFRRLREKAQNQGNLHVLGHVEPVYPFLEAADAFISLSCYEGLPLAVLEASSFNLPLILSDIPAHRWIINSKLGHGILVDSYNPSLTQILSFLDDTEKRKRVIARPFLKQFTWIT